MLKNYLKIAWRNLVRNKMFSLINILGLALAMTFALIIFIWVLHETSFDQFHSKKERIHVVMGLDEDNHGNLVTDYNTTGSLAEALMKDVPEIQYATKITSGWTALVRTGDKKFNERLSFADSSFFSIFDFPLIAGSRDQLFKNPFSVVITSEMALKYFNKTDVVGEILHIKEYDLEDDFTITGVVENIPTNSSIQFDFLAPFASILPKKGWMNDWGSRFLTTYVLLNKNSYKKTVNSKIREIPLKYYTWDYKIFLHSLEEMHVYNEVKVNRAGDEFIFHGEGLISYIRLFSIVAIVILFLGCINFMNLSTAVAGKRAREIGLRKITGAKRYSIVFQFLGEAMLLAAISLVLSITLVYVLLPLFSSIVGETLHIPYNNTIFAMILILVPVITGVLAGSYPAFYLSSFRPAHTLKQVFFGKFSDEYIRRGLVIFQMSVSVVLIISTTIILLQINFIKNKDLGISKDNVVYFDFHQGINSNKNAFEEAMRESPYVKDFSYTSDNPLQIYSITGDPKWEGMAEGEHLHFRIIHGGWDFAETLDMTIKDGRSFSGKMATDSTAVIINEEAARMMGLSEPVGKRIDYWDRKWQIIGVVKNFHYLSMQNKIEPLIIDYWPENASYIIAKVEGQNTRQAISDIQKIYESFEKEFPFEYHFLDQEYEKIYKSEVMLGKLTNVFAFLAIFISCLGLYGLVAYTTKKKNKEISIRKVNGATIRSLLLLLTSSYMRWVVIANIIGWPIAWYLMRKWLEGYVYKIEIEWWVFGLAGLFIIVTTLLTVSLQTLKAATANPVKSLRYE